MPRKKYHEQLRSSYLKYVAIRDLVNPPNIDDTVQRALQIQLDLAILNGIRNTRYLRARNEVQKAGNIHLAWEYAQNEEDYGRFINMLRVSPTIFELPDELVVVLSPFDLPQGGFGAGFQRHDVIRSV